jgi:broad-specificity NMP kinase
VRNRVDCELHDVVKEEVYDSYSPDIIFETNNNQETDVKYILGQVFEALKKLDFLKRLGQ